MKSRHKERHKSDRITHESSGSASSHVCYANFWDPSLMKAVSDNFLNISLICHKVNISCVRSLIGGRFQVTSFTFHEKCLISRKKLKVLLEMSKPNCRQSRTSPKMKNFESQKISRFPTPANPLLPSMIKEFFVSATQHDSTHPSMCSIRPTKINLQKFASPFAFNLFNRITLWNS